MTVNALVVASILLTATLSGEQVAVGGQGQAPTFRSSVDLVRVSTVVRDHKGRFVQNLTSRDFEILDDGLTRAVQDLHHELSNVSVALLFDISGSMEGNLALAREAAGHVLGWLGPADEVAVFTFDTRLAEVAPFTAGLKRLPGSMSSVVPFGATSLHDAIAQTARRLTNREGRRGAVVVFTDGNDNASRLTASEVSTLASSIDVPVYIFGAVLSIDDPSSEFSAVGSRSPLSGSLSDLATWTGGHVFVASTPAARSAAARQIIDELRHQYVIAFEAGSKPGWHALVVRVREKDLDVRARNGYLAGQSRPIS